MLKDVLTEDLIDTDVAAVSWREAAAACGDLLVQAGKVKAEFITSMIEVVETFGPYMILVPEVAFFHGQPGENVLEPCLSLITLKEPVYFTEYANQKIRCAFGFGAVDNESHLAMLQAVSALLQDEEFIRLITHNGLKEDIMGCIGKY